MGKANRNSEAYHECHDLTKSKEKPYTWGTFHYYVGNMCHCPQKTAYGCVMRSGLAVLLTPSMLLDFTKHQSIPTLQQQGRASIFLGKIFKLWQNNFGTDGNRTICITYNVVKSGKNISETWSLLVSCKWRMTRHSATNGLQESSTEQFQAVMDLSGKCKLRLLRT